MFNRNKNKWTTITFNKVGEFNKNNVDTNAKHCVLAFKAQDYSVIIQDSDCFEERGNA